MLVENKSGKYAIIEVEDGYIDANGCYYRKLTEQQKLICGKMYFYDIFKSKDWVVLSIKKIVTKTEEGKVSFDEVIVANYLFKNGYLCGNQTIDFSHVLANSLNPEEFISYLALILSKKGCYEEFLDWLDYTRVDRNRLKEDIYVYVFYAFVTKYDGIITELLKKGMKKTLYDFLRFYYRERDAGTQYHAAIKISECMENEFFSGYSRLGNTDDSYGFSLSCDILNRYGKENLDSVLKFIKSMKKIHETSLFQKKAFEQTAEMLRVLCNISIAIPGSAFNKNVNYLLKMVFKNYEEKISLEGFLNVSKMWEDYLLMKEYEDEDYPDSIKESHDRVQKICKGRKISKEILTMFSSAVKKYEDLEFKDNKYQVRVPKSPAEMREVGDKLENCVETYTTAVAKQKTQVLWLCECDEKIMALEVKNRKLIQAKTKGNHYPNAEEEEFIKKWCKEKQIDIVSY